jgi:hypothetical protein
MMLRPNSEAVKLGLCGACQSWFQQWQAEKSASANAGSPCLGWNHGQSCLRAIIKIGDVSLDVPIRIL